MYYAAIGTLGIVILFLENLNILLKRDESVKLPAWKMYRRFLFAVLFFFISDVLWGVIEAQKLPVLLFIDSSVYFIATACALFFWTQYTVTYLRERSLFGKLLMLTGRIFFGAVTLIVIVNIFVPILFSVDAQGVYHASVGRSVILILQIVLLVLISFLAFVASVMRKRDTIGKRYRTIAFFGLILAVFITIQIWYPYLPLYSVAYLLGTCLLHNFVVNDEREEYKTQLEKAYEREKQQFNELKTAWNLAYKDSLTGVNSKSAYAEAERRKDEEIENKAVTPFAIAVLDLNNLKTINDKQGHEQGNQYIIRCTKLICDTFKHSAVFRIGGDEFAALMENEDYHNRNLLYNAFNKMMEDPENEAYGYAALGMAEYIPGQDGAFADVFKRADQAMYERKHDMKSRLNLVSAR